MTPLQKHARNVLWDITKARLVTRILVRSALLVIQLVPLAPSLQIIALSVSSTCFCVAI